MEVRDGEIRVDPAPRVDQPRWGVFEAAMSVHLDRYLNVPPARLPEPDRAAPEEAPTELPALLDERQRVDAATNLVARYQERDEPKC
jgi:hypothetical protein